MKITLPRLILAAFFLAKYLPAKQHKKYSINDEDGLKSTDMI
jgi:hypothetical protein